MASSRKKQGPYIMVAYDAVLDDRKSAMILRKKYPVSDEHLGLLQAGLVLDEEDRAHEGVQEFREFVAMLRKALPDIADVIEDSFGYGPPYEIFGGRKAVVPIDLLAAVEASESTAGLIKA